MKSPPGRARVVWLALAAGGLVGVLLGGCGSSTPTLDSAAVERAVAASILTERHVQATVLCPSNLARKAGLTFTCTAKLDAGTYPVAVIEKDAAGNVRYASQAPLVVLDVTRVQRAITASILAQRRLRATVSCPVTVLQQAGVRFTCTATVGGRRYPFEVTEVNANGQVRYLGR
ncbi:MAG TPA: DUF4333 domain-containing protein [Solirubrobacteraceae bacterium]|nr:DUF4333 domain-containing protein [Solirubrobacteraceae bacterium]